MTVRVSHVIDAFLLLYSSLWRKEFRKSIRFHEFSERQLLPIARAFLLGYFGESIVPEAVSLLPGGLSGFGRIDFLIENTAVELVVRTPSSSASILLPNQNVTEIKKLLKHDGPAVLVLYDLSASPLEKYDLNRYRSLPSLGRGNHSKSAFSVAYFCLRSDEGEIEPAITRLNIRCL